MPAQPTRDVDGYIAAAPEAARPLLTELRETIRAAAPQAEERISYGMPYYHLHGVRLTYFQAHTRHIGLYAFAAEDARADETGLGSTEEPPPHPSPLGRGSPSELVARLARAERPLVLVGLGTRWRDAPLIRRWPTRKALGAK